MGRSPAWDGADAHPVTAAAWRSIWGRSHVIVRARRGGFERRRSGSRCMRACPTGPIVSIMRRSSTISAPAYTERWSRRSPRTGMRGRASGRWWASRASRGGRSTSSSRTSRSASWRPSMLIAARGVERIRRAYAASQGDLEERLRIGLEELAEGIGANWKGARLVIVDAQTAGPAGLARLRGATSDLRADAVSAALPRSPEPSPLAMPVVRGIVGGLHWVLSACMRTGDRTAASRPDRGDAGLGAAVPLAPAAGAAAPPACSSPRGSDRGERA